MWNWAQGHPYETAILVLAVLGVLIALLQYLRREPTSAPTSVADIDAQRSAIAAGANNTQRVNSHDINFNIQTPSAEAAPVFVSQRVLPNLVYAGPRSKRIFIGPWENIGFRDPQDEDQRQHAVEGFVLKFENRLRADGQRIAPARHVIARLRFHHTNRVTFRDFDYGVWLNSPTSSEHIGVGDTCELVLICNINDVLQAFGDLRRGSAVFGGEGFNYFEYSDVSAFDLVDLTLIDRDSQAEVRLRLRFWRDHGAFNSCEV